MELYGHEFDWLIIFLYTPQSKSSRVSSKALMKRGSKISSVCLLKYLRSCFDTSIYTSSANTFEGLLFNMNHFNLEKKCQSLKGLFALRMLPNNSCIHSRNLP